MDDYTEMREDTKRRVLEMVDKLPDEPFCRWVLDIPGIWQYSKYEASGGCSSHSEMPSIPACSRCDTRGRHRPKRRPDCERRRFSSASCNQNSIPCEVLRKPFRRAPGQPMSEQCRESLRGHYQGP